MLNEKKNNLMLKGLFYMNMILLFNEVQEQSKFTYGDRKRMVVIFAERKHKKLLKDSAHL